MEDPFVLLRRLKLGREEYCQRLLTMLILEAPYPPWNTRNRPCERGKSFLKTLDELSFGDAAEPDDAVFVDELDLPSMEQGRPGCAPDYGVITENRLWLIELKTEKTSHRLEQIPAYLDMGRRHYSELAVDLTYLTPAMPEPNVDVPPGCRFAHLTWTEVIPRIRDAWGQASSPHAEIRDALIDALTSIGTAWPDWRQQTLDDLRGLAMRSATATATDGRQRAFDHAAPLARGIA